MVTKEGEEATAEAKAEETKPAPAATTEPDYKAEVETYKGRATQLEEENRRLKTRLDGAQGTIHQRQDLETEIRRNRQEMGEVKGILQMLAKAQAETTPELAQRLIEMDTRSEEQRQKSLTEDRLYEDWGLILSFAAKAEGKPLVTDDDGAAIAALLQSDPAWREVNALTQDGFRKMDTKLVRQALHKARDIAEAKAEQSHNAKLQAEVTRVKQEAEADKQKALSPFMKSINPAAAGTGAKGRKPTYEEIRDASPAEYQAKKTSGEWLV